MHSSSESVQLLRPHQSKGLPRMRYASRVGGEPRESDLSGRWDAARGRLMGVKSCSQHEQDVAMIGRSHIHQQPLHMSQINYTTSLRFVSNPESPKGVPCVLPEVLISTTHFAC
jgi:hypothetical protein